MFTYYANLSVRQSLLIDTDLYEKAIKRIYAGNRLGLRARVSSTNKRGFERARNEIGIKASTSFHVKKFLNEIEPNIINMKAPQINIASVKFLNGLGNGIQTSQTLAELKHGLERFSDKLHILADVSEMKKICSEQYNGRLDLLPGIDNLLYRDTRFNGTSRIALEASVKASLKRCRLLIELDNNCALGGMIPLSDIDSGALSAIDGGSLLQMSYEMSTDKPFIDTTLIQGYIPLRDADAESLADIDGKTLETLSLTLPPDLPYIDNMTLEELDFVTLED